MSIRASINRIEEAAQACYDSLYDAGFEKEEINVMTIDSLLEHWPTVLPLVEASIAYGFTKEEIKSRTLSDFFNL
jgi:hypothetical protein